MGITATTHQKKCHSKTTCTLQATVRVNTLETGILSNSLTSQCTENIQVVLVLKEESRCLQSAEHKENPVIIVWYLNADPDALAP